jgi:formylglycine-generating enzyme required for sulfatase activity
MPDGIVEIGHAGETFCFDNETPRHRVLLQGHALASRAVTNGEYQEFIRDGGYTTPSLWLSDGWAKVNSEGWRGRCIRTMTRRPYRSRPARH